MRNAFIICMTGALMSCAVSAQTESLEDIFGALSDAPEKAPVEKKVEVPVEAEIDVEAVIEESREQLLGGKFIEAQRGFEAVLAVEPENKLAQMYLRTLQGRSHQKAVCKGLGAVDAAWDTDVVLRSYALASDALDKMDLANVVKATDVIHLFPQVDFPAEGSAIYQPQTSILYVRNTLKNFEVFESVLDAMNILKSSDDVDQVEIEAKFVEVAEGALEELGFQWDYTEEPANLRLAGQDLDVYDNRGLLADSLRGSPNGTSSMPFGRTDTLGGDGETAAGGSDWTAFRFEDAFSADPAALALDYRGSDPYEVIISALDQKNGTDVLSAPRVVAENGESAKIRVGQLHTFPEVYEVSANEGNIVHVQYQDFEDKLLGVELDVTPKVKGDQITLELNPQITELVSWQHYEVAPKDSAYTYYQFRVNEKFYHDAIVAKLPVFKKRAIKTTVTIADGGTIGMGGLMSEKNEAFEDKVPVLGSLPLVGRLFRNEGERAVKRNMLMFVTAKKVEPTGSTYSTRSFE